MGTTFMLLTKCCGELQRSKSDRVSVAAMNFTACSHLWMSSGVRFCRNSPEKQRCNTMHALPNALEGLGAAFHQPHQSTPLQHGTMT